MSARFKHAKVLVRAAKRRLTELDDFCEQYLAQPSEENLLDLQERTKELLDKLRPAIDYCATELYVGCNGHEPLPTEKVYFPISRKSAKRTDFKGEACKNIPGIKAHPGLLTLLESFQAFSSPGNSWLPDLATLNVENKHDQFSHQESVTCAGVIFSNVFLTGLPPSQNGFKELCISASGGISLPKGATLSADGVTIHGPRLIRGHPPHLHPTGPEENLLRKVTLIDTKFKLNNEIVQRFLRRAIDGVEHIVLELEACA